MGSDTVAVVSPKSRWNSYARRPTRYYMSRGATKIRTLALDDDGGGGGGFSWRRAKTTILRGPPPPPLGYVVTVLCNRASPLDTVFFTASTLHLLVSPPRGPRARRRRVLSLVPGKLAMFLGTDLSSRAVKLLLLFLAGWVYKKKHAAFPSAR